jgi:hypothetical protein
LLTTSRQRHRYNIDNNIDSDIDIDDCHDAHDNANNIDIDMNNDCHDARDNKYNDNDTDDKDATATPTTTTLLMSPASLTEWSVRGINDNERQSTQKSTEPRRLMFEKKCLLVSR